MWQIYPYHRKNVHLRFEHFIICKIYSKEKTKLNSRLMIFMLNYKEGHVLMSLLILKYNENRIDELMMDRGV